MSLIEETRRDMYRTLSYMPKTEKLSVFESAMETHLCALHEEIKRLQLANRCAGEALREKVESLKPISEEGARILRVTHKAIRRSIGPATSSVFTEICKEEFGFDVSRQAKKGAHQ